MQIGATKWEAEPETEYRFCYVSGNPARHGMKSEGKGYK